MKKSSVITSVVIFATALTVTDKNGKVSYRKAVVNVATPINGISAFYFTEGEIKNLAQPIGGLYNLLPTLAPGGTLEIETTQHKIGESWVNKATGETGLYTKDWSQTRATSLTLSMAAAANLAVVTMQNNIVAPVAEPAKKAETPVILPD